MTDRFRGLKEGFRDFCTELHSEKERSNRQGFRVLFRKELADHLMSIRFLILYLLLFVVSCASLNGAISTLAQNALQTSDGQTAVSDFIFLELFTTSGSAIYSFTTFLGFLGPIFGIMLGFDAINNEQSQGTLNRLAAQPIYRDTIINAKFAAGAALVFLTVFSLGGFLTGFGILFSGLTPQPEEIARILLFLLLAAVYISVWLAFAVFFSVICRHAATSALSCVAIWLFLTMFLSLVASGLAGIVYPLSGMGAQVNALKNYQLQVAFNRISPYYLFSEATTMILNPNVRSLNIMSLLEYQKGAIASYLSFGQSLLEIWPHLVGMFALAVAGFALAYISFMRREIRA